MLNTTVAYLRCPRKRKANQRCLGNFKLVPKKTAEQKNKNNVFEINSGEVHCQKCGSKFPILSGVLILVDQVHDYILSHVKGISKIVSISDIPKEIRSQFIEARNEISVEHLEEDLEAERVNSLYVMNHYLKANPGNSSKDSAWWKPKEGQGSPLMESLICEYWDKGPFEQIRKWLELRNEGKGFKLLELGCGVGGLYSTLKNNLNTYLGIDSSFASIAIARHLNLGVSFPNSILIPEDLLFGPVSRKIKIPSDPEILGNADFIVGDMENPPIASEVWDAVVSLNTIDMMDDPALLPKIKFDLLKPGGFALQSCPYIWHPHVAKRIRKKLPAQIQDSASAVEFFYEQSGFKIEERSMNLPWLFFKHLRQLEIYSVHAFIAKKRNTSQV